MLQLYRLNFEQLVVWNEVSEIEAVIQNTNEKNEAAIDWTNAWSKKYPVLATYASQIDVSKYAVVIRQLLQQLEAEHYNSLDAMLVLKDILYHEWKGKK